MEHHRWDPENQFPMNHYYPPYYYPMYPIDQYQNHFSNSQQPLFFEVPEQQGQPSLPQHLSPFVEYFQDDQGEVDIDKVIATANQFMKTASQIGPVVKTLNDFVKGMKF
ncbi:YppG family protein [Aquisalibacillus elongatus]|uniref:YppG-like protein n=1 Tax=Aquisalibacillus elongatus TaxID=485577 RepID=A0A3N5CDN0_9BACI|nr:YppG family protein [Aquisalibacillus elongatus]RPF57085.1 YppG-like protein [Aquisalibacillus elongatus]